MTIAIPKTIKEHRYGEFLGKIWREVNVKNGIVTIVFCGKRGTGKSYSMSEWARVLDRDLNDKERFKPEDIKFDPVEFLTELTGEYHRGKVHILDDAGLHLYKSDALKDVLKKVSKVLQNIRYQNPIIMMSLPHFEQLMKDARTMTDIYIEMQGIDEARNLALGKIQHLKVSPFSGDLYRYNVLQAKKVISPEFGIPIIHWEKRPFLFNKPPAEFANEYERIKKKLLNKLNRELVNSIKKTTKKEIGEEEDNSKMNFPQSVEYCKERIEKFISQKGKIDVTAILMETNEKGEQMFAIERAKLISQVLRKENLSKIIEQKIDQEKPQNPLPESRIYQKRNHSKSRYTARELKEKPKNLTPL